MKRNTANFLLGVIGVLMIATLPTASFAQSVESLTAGTRVRVRTDSSSRWRVGYLQSIDSLAISATTTSPGQNKATTAAATHLWTVPLSSVNRVEVSRGRGGRAARTILGAVIGGVGGGLIIGTLGYMATTCTSCEESGIGVLAGPLLGAPIGFLFGGMVGFTTPRERWEPISIGGSRIPTPLR
ncbi:MAG: hypothetical protein ABI556_12995 [Gemmatimonadales bacterium]